MLHVKDAKYVSGHVLWIAFDDGTFGEVDLKGQLHGPVFEPLKDEFFLLKSQLMKNWRLSSGLMALIWLQSS